MAERIYSQEGHLQRLVTMMDLLRTECPWDRQQTLRTLRPYTLEEAHEVLEAADAAAAGEGWGDLQGELGDLLMQVLFYSRLASEQQEFDLYGVIDALIAKMIYRHPHLFGDARTDAHPDALVEQWERLKEREHPHRQSMMDGIPPLPALALAEKMQRRAARVGFDWPDAQGVLERVGEEVAEMHDALECADDQQVEMEFGDLLFTLVNLGRKLGVDAEVALLASSRKFARRFRAMERSVTDDGVSLSSCSSEQLERIYERVKEQENE
ncbi:MAG: nucleoside triphosphate pyrophosphohydrolase [Mariprofundales bacterium]|nr:nucleoside triphosphate pyrophosphohydrolase [Mariprofundales bacterium]